MGDTLTRIGGGLLCLGAVVIGWVPIQFGTELAIIGGSFILVGLAFAALVGLCGLVAVLIPEYGLYAGVMGVLFSVLSLIGALGGLFVGMVIGVIGGVLAIVGGSRENANTASA